MGIHFVLPDMLFFSSLRQAATDFHFTIHQCLMSKLPAFIIFILGWTVPLNMQPVEAMWLHLFLQTAFSIFKAVVSATQQIEQITASWRTPPTPPTVSSSSYHQEDGTGASEPAPPDCSTAFSPRLWEPWTQITPPPSETPCNTLPPETWTPNPPPPPPPPQPYLSKEILWTFFCAIQVCYTQVSGPVQTTCSNTLSSMH